LVTFFFFFFLLAAEGKGVRVSAQATFFFPSFLIPRMLHPTRLPFPTPFFPLFRRPPPESRKEEAERLSSLSFPGQTGELSFPSNCWAKRTARGGRPRLRAARRRGIFPPLLFSPFLFLPVEAAS